MKNQSTYKTPEGTLNREVMGSLSVDWGNPSGVFIWWETSQILPIRLYHCPTLRTFFFPKIKP
jgi:hypothetical protein